MNEYIILNLKNNPNKREEIYAYLTNLNQETYLFLIDDLIDICLLEKDEEYRPIRFILKELTNSKYPFSLNDYILEYVIEDFYQALSQNKVAVAEKYFHIMTRAKELELITFDLTIIENRWQEIMRIEKKQRQQQINYFMKDREFTDVLNSLYELIIQGLSFADATLALNLSLEKRQIIVLRWAKECFKQGLIKEGDKFLLWVEKSKKESPIVLEILQEIRKKRLFYQHRFQDSLSLVLIPSLKQNPLSNKNNLI